MDTILCLFVLDLRKAVVVFTAILQSRGCIEVSRSIVNIPTFIVRLLTEIKGRVLFKMRVERNLKHLLTFKNLILVTKKEGQSHCTFCTNFVGIFST